MRAGGKHNDLENVGFTRRHHTFFEMLGNFSFGDYFKREAIAYAWELVTSPEWFGLPKDKLYVTIFKGENGLARDVEAYQFWLDVGVAKDRIFEMGMKDNFWQMGDTGPCGPCSEIFYDMGLEASESGKDLPFGEDEARYVEIWNLVFMQFDRMADGTLVPLPKPSIDTGAGLERLAAVLQGVISNFETDLFVPLIERAAELVGSKPTSENPDVGHPGSSPSLRIIADHARAATFLISDGVHPANEGRGYVLRKILRRGIRHGRLLGQEKPFMYQMVDAVRDDMQDAYPELKETTERVARVVEAEEKQFARVLESGARQLDELISTKLSLRDEPIGMLKSGRTTEEIYAELSQRKASISAITGADAFHLYETYGLPLDFMVDAAHDAGIAFDMEGFERARAEEQARARASWKGGAKSTASPAYRELPKTFFEGYRQLVSTNCEVLALVKNGVGARDIQSGDAGEVVLDHTSFYADSGGQVGDHGWLYSDDGKCCHCGSAGLHQAGAGNLRASGHCKAAHPFRRQAADCCRSGIPRGHGAQPYRHPPAPRCAARDTGYACKAGRFTQ